MGTRQDARRNQLMDAVTPSADRAPYSPPSLHCLGFLDNLTRQQFPSPPPPPGRHPNQPPVG